MEAARRLELYREMYSAESDRRNDLNEGINGILTVATIIGGGAVFLLDSAPPADSGAWRTVFVVALSSGTVLLICALLLLVRAWTGFEYDYVADAQQLEDWWKELEDYDREYPPNQYERGAIPAAAVRFQRTLIDQYASASHSNRRTNIRKASLADASKIALSWAALAFATAMLPHYIHNRTRDAAGGRHESQENTAASAAAPADGAAERRKRSSDADSHATTEARSQDG